MTSSPLRPGASMEEELDYYKKQYEQLETDLADFQSSSKDLEEQLERDIETAERNEHKLKGQVEKLNYEVEEWKQKHKQAKTEANSAQNALQKEVTALREGRRQLELRLRDIEVVNDDYERQARNTESSLEDMESKYNVTIERGVMLEEEVKVGEKEREELRIEAQRLRDELGELKVENEITQEKLRKADRVIEKLRQRKPSPPLAVKELRPSQQRPRSPTASEASGVTPASPTASTPPPKSDSMTEASTPPSPPLSDAPAHANGVKSEGKPTLLHKLRGSAQTPDLSATPKPYFPSSSAASRHAPSPAVRKPTRHSRAPSSVTISSTGTQSATSDPYRSSTSMRPPPSSSTRTRLTSTRPSTGSTTSSTPTAAGGAESTTSSTTGGGNALPRSDSLHQIKALRGRMQKIEERVHSARSKLPAPQPGTTAGSMIAPGGGLARTPTKLRGSPAHRMSPSHYQRGSTPTGGGSGGGGSPSAASQPGGAGLPGSVTLRKSSRMMTPRGSGIGGAVGGAGGGSHGNSRTGSPAAGGHSGGGGGGDSFAKRIASGEKLMTAEHHRKISGSGIKRKDGASWAGGKRLSYGLLPRPGGSGIGGPGGGGYRSPSSSLARPISRTEVGAGAGGGRNGTGAGSAGAEGRRPASRSSLGLSMSYAQQQQQRPGSRQSSTGVGVDSRPASRAGGGGRQSMSNTSSSSRPSSSHRPRSSMGGSAAAATPGTFASAGGLGMYATVHGTPRGAAATGGGGGHKPSASLADIRRRAVAEEQEEVGETY
ncbi:hypothetical protein D0869_06565 [Hortaea werneckii]|uniref:NUDE domain-containing protein n=1 Tax=Hortaea werneckii TaxID=91943 RepID=A0A3M6WTI9_HORWE|nr:hypothetical protein KC324_g5575 [Hortaea werneckii]KAI7586648.1 hypothetical protein KC316_g5472 [Hortaea werneckii]RMX81769.1 hypothetical protein D0869_06565 [Hortaea werneckii]RMX94202.1 hypothetical protein D0868_12425 [Hortaea werneckii]RMY18905.1 hypothetical protein D0867_05031 [Hortaea werneckii]